MHLLGGGRSNVYQITALDVETKTELAELAYQNQKLERERPVNMVLAKYGANWPCMWGEEATGLVSTWKDHWDKYKDGWKFTCGLEMITEPCVVYSLGSAGNMAFEAAVLAKKPQCELHIFDKNTYDLEAWFPKEKGLNVTFHRAFISKKDDWKFDPPMRSLGSLMAELGHQHIDILKADIEGDEFEMLSDATVSPRTGQLQLDPKAWVPSIGQLQLEVHLRERHKREDEYQRLFENIEASGLRLFHKEVNARFDTNCTELSFIQQSWRPEVKQYVH